MKPTPKVSLAALVVAALTLGVTFDGLAHARVMMSQTDKQTRRPWLGVYLRDVTPEFAKKENLKTEEGTYVTRVVRRSPADSAGIKKGDVIVEFNGRQIYDSDDLIRSVRRAEVGSKGKIVVMRGSEKKELQVTLRRYPRRLRSRAFTFPSIPHRIMIFRGTGTQGLSLMDLTPQLGRYFEAPDGKGVLVESVEEGSAAETAGFKAGDVILRIGDTKVENLQDVREELSEFEEGEKVNVEILRKGSRMTLSLEIEESEGPSELEFFFGGDWPPGPPDDIHIEFDQPGKDHWFDFRIPDPKPQLEKLLIDLDQIRKKLERQNKDLLKQIRQQLGKVRMAVEV